MSFKDRGRTCSKLEHHEGVSAQVEDEIPSTQNGAVILTNVVSECFKGKVFSSAKTDFGWSCCLNLYYSYKFLSENKIFCKLSHH